MKNLTLMPWMAYACLLMEALALIFVTLMLVCPTPFQHNNLAVILIQPNVSPSSSNVTAAPIGQFSTISVPSNTSVNSSPVSTSSSANPSSSTLNASTSAGKASSTSTNTTSSNTSISSTPTSTPTLSRRGSDTTATSDSFAQDVPLNHENATIAAEDGTVKEDDSAMARVTQLERLNTTTSPIYPSNASVTASSVSNSTILLRIGPLGSCFRESNNVETCTPAKLNSQYDFSQLQHANFITSGLPTGMHTYPTILVVIIVVLLLKVIQNIAAIFVPSQHLPSSVSSSSSSWHAICNWIICSTFVLLGIASGVQRNKMSVAVKSFNAANQTTTMNSVPLLAQTGTSFGFIWISVLLLGASFLINRITMKKQAMLDRAKQQLLADPANRYHSDQPPLPMYSRTNYSNHHEEVTTPEAKRSSGLGTIRQYLQSRKVDDTSSSRTPYSGSEISLPTKVLDDYIRRHYHPSDYSDMPKAVKLDHLNDFRRYAKESPPFHAYQSSLDGAESKRQEEADYIEEVRHRLASPAPSYWTMPERDHQDSIQTRREKERQYMAELRRQRSTMG